MTMMSWECLTFAPPGAPRQPSIWVARAADNYSRARRWRCPEAHEAAAVLLSGHTRLICFSVLQTLFPVGPLLAVVVMVGLLSCTVECVLGSDALLEVRILGADLLIPSIRGRGG